MTSPNDCLDIRQMISQGVTQAQLQAYASSLRTELLRDQRVLSAAVQISYDPVKNVTTITENVQTSAGPFTLTLTLSTGSIAVILAGQ